MENRELPSTGRVIELLQAFDEVQAADYRRARQLDTLTEAVKWPELHTLYGSMYDRLSAIQSYLPLGAPSNYRGGYALDELAARTETARLGAGDYYLDLASAGIRAARAGSKSAAREAYYDLDRVGFYLPERRPALTPVSDEMRDRGTVRIRVILSGDITMQAAAGELNSYRGPVREAWYAVDFRDTGQGADLEAEVQLTDYSSWGPTESSSCTTYSKEVLDYVEKQEYEERINDSTVVTKVREIEHFKTITATVTEVQQQYSLSASGELSVFDLMQGQRTRPLPLNGSGDWKNEYSTCSGDSDALPPFACSGSSSFPPSTAYMLDQALEELLNSALYELRRGYAP